MGRESCTNAKAKYSSSVVPPDPSVHFYHWTYGCLQSLPPIRLLSSSAQFSLSAIVSSTCSFFLLSFPISSLFTYLRHVSQWWCAGLVRPICLERGADLHVAQLMSHSLWCRGHSVVMETELLQQLQDLACGTLFQSSCVIPTSPYTDCSDDSWRDTFFGKNEHGALWLLICGAIEKHLPHVCVRHINGTLRC